MRPKWDLATIIAQHLDELNEWGLNSHQYRHMKALAQCRTAALGGHKQGCSSCGEVRMAYNSCRNRHCPKCQNTLREKWIMQREAEMLNCPYFHVVFTLPSALNELVLYAPELVFGCLFSAAWQTILDFATDPKHLGAETGMTAVLHTWGQNLSLHPHLHCIVPGGGLDFRGQWKTARSKGKFLFPVRAMSLVFRAKYVELLRKKCKAQEIEVPKGLFKKLFANQWVVYAKRPFGSVKSVIDYLGRYSHKVAITNHRVIDIGKDTVRFSYKDYRQEAKKKQMTLSHREFIRRFALHILPHRFVRIRHFGIFQGRYKRRKLNRARHSLGQAPMAQKTKLDWQQIAKQRLHFDPNVCPACKKPTMRPIAPIPAKPIRAP